MDKLGDMQKDAGNAQPLTCNDERWLERIQRELNQAQYQFVTASDPVILGLAGPGSGKTRALVYRAAHLIKCGVLPGQMLLLTFTNKAAEEMKQRLEKLLGFLPRELWAGTFHSIGARILRCHAPYAGRTGNFTIFDDEDSKRLFKQLVNTASREIGEEERALLLKRGMLARVISQARNSGLSIEQAIEDSYPCQLEYRELVESLAGRYERAKQENNACDFDDLLVGWLELFLANPSIRSLYQDRFNHLLVDEFQDTNLVQGRLIDLFAGRCSICVVGDDAQSIYAFRYAEIGNITAFPDKYPRCRVIPMEQNYRSTPEIVALANHSITYNRGQLKKKLFSHNPPAEKPCLNAALDATGEASFVVRKVIELHRAGLPLSEIAILYRSSYLASEIEFQLVRSGIRYRTFGGLKFLQKAHIRDMLAYLKVLYNPRDEVSWRRIVTQQPGLGDGAFNALWEQMKGLPDPLEAAIEGRVAPSRGKKAWAPLRQALLAAREASSELPLLFKTIMEQGYVQYLAKNYPDQLDERILGIERLVAYASRFDSLASFLESLALEESLFADGSTETQKDEYLTLSTVHSAKGKEWEAVFVIALNMGSFPSRRSSEQDVEEERRLFYVAVTRARSRLFLSTYRYDYRSWGSASGEPSLFLQELPIELYETVSLADPHAF